MFKQILLSVVVLAIGLSAIQVGGNTQDSNASSQTLLNELSKYKSLGYRFSQDKYSFWVVSVGLEERLEKYYASRDERRIELELLDKKVKSGELKDDPESLNEVVATIKLLRKELRHPLGNYRFGHVTSAGKDYIGITEPGGGVEYLIHERDIGFVRRDT